MQRVRMRKGPYAGLSGDLVRFPQSNQFSISIPSLKNPQIKEFIVPKEVGLIEESRCSPILALEENTTLQYANQVQMLVYKKACASVWCKQCFTNKGGSRRIADRLNKLNWRKTRQVILTIDPKKFESGKQAYDLIRKKGALHQYIHNLKRTSGVVITDWMWILEWHRNGFPHWHLFIEVEKGGKAGMIGNSTLLKHWRQYGIVRESHIRSAKHWNYMTGYFGSFGYFKIDGKDKSHQLELPEWAKQADYRIRKHGSMGCVNKGKKLEDIEESKSGDIDTMQFKQSWNNLIFIAIKFKDEKTTLKLSLLLYLHLVRVNQYKINSIKKEPRIYEDLLNSCGQQIMALIRRGDGLQVWRKYDIPYKMFINQYSGEFIEHIGYISQMDSDEFFLFEAFYDVGEPENIENQTIQKDSFQSFQSVSYGNC